MKKFYVLLVCLMLTAAGYAAPIGYWELDVADGVGQDAYGNYDLLTYGTITNFATHTNPIPNPGLEPGFIGDPAFNPGNAHLGYESNATNRNGLYSASVIPAMQFAKDRPFTIEGWARTSAGSYQYVVGNYGATGNYSGFYILAASTGLKFEIRQNGVAVGATSAAGAFSTYVNRHFAGVWDPSTGENGQLRLYINGVLAASADGSALWDNNPVGGVLSIGGRNFDIGSPSWYFSGQLDEMRFSNVALSPEYFLNGTIPTPEPATMVILALGALAAVRKRQR